MKRRQVNFTFPPHSGGFWDLLQQYSKVNNMSIGAVCRKLVKLGLKQWAGAAPQAFTCPKCGEFTKFDGDPCIACGEE